MNKRSLLFIAILAVGGFGAYFLNVAYQTQLGEKALMDTGLAPLSLEEAMSAAEDQSKLVLADLSAIWCSSCRKLDQNVLANEKVKKAIAEKYVFARIEYESDEGAAFMKKYDVSGFPTLLIIKPNGEKARRLQTVFDPAAFLTQL